jgi:hypothetical protein
MRLRKLCEGLCCLLVSKLRVAGMSLMPAFERGDTITQSQLAKSSSSRRGEISATNTALTQVALRDRVQLDDELLHGPDDTGRRAVDKLVGIQRKTALPGLRCLAAGSSDR